MHFMFVLHVHVPRRRPTFKKRDQNTQSVFYTKYLILLFPFISIHLESTIYITAQLWNCLQVDVLHFSRRGRKGE